MGRKRKITNWKIGTVTKFFLLNSITLALVIILFVLLIYTLLEKKNLQDISRLRQMALGNMNYRSSEAFSSACNLTYQIFNDNDAIAVMMAPERDISSEVRLSRTIENLMISNPLLHSVYICSHDRVLLRKSKDSSYNLEKEEDLFRLIFTSRILSPLKRRIPQPGGNSLNLLTLIYHSAYPHNEAMDGAVIVNLDADAFYRFIAPEQLPEGSSLLIVDGDGTIMLHRDREYFLRPLGTEPYMERIIQSPEQTGYFLTDREGIRISLNFYRSDSSGYIFLLLDPYETIAGEIGHFKMVILIISLAVIFVSLTAFFFITSAAFQPMRDIITNIRGDSGLMKILDKEGESKDFAYISQTFSALLDHINLLEHREEEASYTIRNRLFFHTLIKPEKREDLSQLREDMNASGISFDGGGEYTLLILRIDNYGEFIRRHSGKSRNLVLLSFSRIAGEILGEEGSFQAFESEEDLCAVLLRRERDKGADDLAAGVSRIQENIGKLLNLSATASFSSPFVRLEDLPGAWEEALALSCYRLFQGNGRIFSGENTGKDGTPSLQRDREDLVSAVKRDDAPYFRSKVGELLEDLVRYPFAEGINVITALILDLQKTAADLGWKSDPEGPENPAALARSIESRENREELVESLCATFRAVADYLSELNNLEARSLMDDALRYIGENYTDGQLSGAQVAREFAMTPPYFSKLFIERTGRTFPQYLNHIRLEKARELLAESGKPAQDIGVDVGYYNRSYFSTLFKQTYGVSPSRYRLTCARRQS